MKVIKDYQDDYLVIETGIVHPKDGKKVELGIRRHALGAYCVILPDRDDPEINDSICIEPSEPAAQHGIDNADVLILAGWALKEAKEYYAENEKANQKALRQDLKVNVSNGPAGSGGFRSGWWQVSFQGKWYNVQCSVPHSMELADQEEAVREAAIEQIPAIIAGNPIYHESNGIALVANTKTQLFPNSYAAEQERKAKEF